MLCVSVCGSVYEMSSCFHSFSGKSPFFQTLEDQTGLLDDPSSHLIDTSVQALTSPSRSSPHSQGSESSERFSRKVFVGGLPPDIDEGSFIFSHLQIFKNKIFGFYFHFFLPMKANSCFTFTFR